MRSEQALRMPSGPKLTSFLTVIILLVLAGSAQAGPWDREFGSLYSKFGVSFFSSDNSFNLGVPSGLEFHSTTYDLYTEVGLPAGFTFVMDLPYVVARNITGSDVSYRNNTFGDGRFGLDFHLIDVPFQMAFGVETKIPLYELIDDHETRDGLIELDMALWPSENFPNIGDGNIDITPKFALGTGIAPIQGWATLEAGYRIRLDGFADGVYWSASVGSFVWLNRIGLNVYANGIHNVQDDPDPRLQASKEYVYLQGSIMFAFDESVDGLGLTTSYGTTVYSNNTSDGWDIALALTYQR